MTELLRRWGGEEVPAGRLMSHGIYDDVDGFRVIVYHSSTKRLFQVAFGQEVAGYRIVNESYRLAEVVRHPGLRSGIFVVKESSWLAWLYEESEGTLPVDDVVHYEICTGDEVIDVASFAPPIVSMVQE